MKGTYGPPLVDMVKNIEVVDAKTLTLEIAIINNYLHPYQNVDLELHLDPKLKVKAVKSYRWSPTDQLIKIGYIPSSLDTEPKDTIIKVEVEMKSSTKAYSIDGIIHYDDTDKGLREKHELESQTFEV